MGGMGGGGMSAGAAGIDSVDRLPRGTTVLVKGLVGAAQHNGKTGRIGGFGEGTAARFMKSLSSMRMQAVWSAVCCLTCPDQ
jgi:hypothetical protein